MYVCIIVEPILSNWLLLEVYLLTGVVYAQLAIPAPDVCCTQLCRKVVQKWLHVLKQHDYLYHWFRLRCACKGDMIWYRSSMCGKGRHRTWFKLYAWYNSESVSLPPPPPVPEPEALQGLCGDVQGSSGVPQETQAGEWKLHSVYWGTSMNTLHACVYNRDKQGVLGHCVVSTLPRILHVCSCKLFVYWFCSPVLLFVLSAVQTVQVTVAVSHKEVPKINGEPIPVK